MKKLSVLMIALIFFFAGCSQSEKETHYTPGEIKQILLDYGLKYDHSNEDIYGYYSNEYVIMIIKNIENDSSLFQFIINDDIYGENIHNGVIKDFANIHINSKSCFYSFTEKKLSENDSESCGQLAIEKSEKIKQKFEAFLKELGISKKNFNEFINDPI